VRWVHDPWLTPSLLAVSLITVLTVGCASPVNPGIGDPTPIPPLRPSPSSTVASPPSLRSSSAGSSTPCVAHDGLPDRSCTPRVVAVDDANVLCGPGYRTSSVRPPQAYTEALKRRQLRAYGYYAGRALRLYEEDHLIPLELGGDPTAPCNLWPQAHATSRWKDAVENAARREVCAGRMGLDEAQASMAADWRALASRLGVAPVH